jgi:site-specific DNA recombinase
LLNFVLSNCTWEDGEVIATFRQSFDMLAETTTAAAHLEADEAAKEPVTREPVSGRNSLLAGKMQGIFADLNLIRRKVYG